MGTRWCIHYAGAPLHDSALVYRKVEEVFDRIVQQMSHWDLHSDLSQFNRASPGTRHVIPQDFFYVLEKAIHVSSLTDGAYDVTIGRWIHAEGFGAEIEIFGSSKEELPASELSTSGNRWGGMAKTYKNHVSDQ